MFFCAHWQTYVSGTLRFGLWVHLRLIRLNLLNPSVWFFFLTIVFSNVFYRVDVTEVQIAIIIMYLMTAFGGVSLWETTVRHSPSLASHWASEVSFSFTTFINSLHYNHWSGLHCGQSQSAFKWWTLCLFLTWCRDMILITSIILCELTAIVFDIYIYIYINNLWLLYQSQLVMLLAY